MAAALSPLTTHWCICCTTPERGLWAAALLPVQRCLCTPVQLETLLWLASAQCRQDPQLAPRSVPHVVCRQRRAEGEVSAFAVAERQRCVDMFLGTTLSHAAAPEEAALLCSCHGNAGYIKRRIRRKIISSVPCFGGQQNILPAANLFCFRQR